jgi:outer membrane receptor protein involved in Fe transport
VPPTSKRCSSCLALPVAAITALAPPLYAQYPGEAIEEIQVTATRRPVAATDASAAVTLIEGEDIRSLKLTTDALAGQPGVFLQQTTPGQGAAIVRGLKGSEVLHLVDGMRMNNAIFRNAPTQYLALVSPATVERIEVLRGSPASLYGSDAVGGVVQVINRMPRFDTAEPSYRREFGFALDSAEQQRSMHASMDAGTNVLAGLVSVDYLDTGNRRIGGGERIVPSGYTSRAFRAALAYTPDERSRWLVDLQFGKQPRTPRVDELVPGFGETEAASEEFYFAPNERSFAHLQYARSGGLLDADWTLDLGWQQIVDDRYSRNTGADIRRLEDNASDLFGLSVVANGAHRAGTWVAGVEVYTDEVTSRRRELDIESGDIGVVQSRFPDGSTVDQAAAFANTEVELSAGHALSGGLRYTIVDVDLPATSLSPSARVDIGDVSADLGWRYALTASTQLVANLGYGFRAPNVFDLGTLGERPGNRFNVPNPSLESEHITQLDIGIRHRGERLAGEIVYWNIDYDDRITSVLTGDVTPDGRDVVQTQNRASARLRGVEAVARLRLGDTVELDVVVNYTRGEQDDAVGMTEPADRVPPLNGRVGLTYAWREDWTFEPYLRFAAEQDRLSARDLEDPRIDPAGTDGWVTANLRTSWYRGEAWALNLALTNMFDERYREHGSGIDAPGRNLQVSLQYLW